MDEVIAFVVGMLVGAFIFYHIAPYEKGNCVGTCAPMPMYEYSDNMCTCGTQDHPVAMKPSPRDPSAP